MSRPSRWFACVALATIPLACSQFAPVSASSADAPGSAGSRAQSSGSSAETLDIPFQKFTLANGLTLVVHEDHKAPIVALNVWYHVGSKNEKPGKTGFAHLFEHLMFEGTENLHTLFFEPIEKAGGTGMNGTTNNDRTNYFENVPKNALDMALWLESDRMGHLLGAIDQGRLDKQRGVVQNEKRQGENQPYGLSQNIITERTAPKGHPYSWTVIGSMEDLNAASLDDVKEWFRTYYGPANATLVVAGDVDTNDVKSRVEKYFGDIPSGPPIARPTEWVQRLSGTQREVMQDRVEQGRITIVWNVAPWGDPSLEQLRLFGDALAGGRSSRLYQRLVLKEQIATDARAFVNARELGSQFSVSVTAKPDVDLRTIEKAVDEELNRLLADGPTSAEVERSRTQSLSGFIRMGERVGGFGGKSDILAENTVFGGDPGLYKRRIAVIEAATPKSVQSAARAALEDNGRFILDVVPFPKFTTAAQGADRAKVPEPGAPPDATFPAFKRAKLGNGLEVILAERHVVPVVEARLLVDCGSSADPANAPGTASFTSRMLDEGTRSLTGTQISEKLELLGARVNAGSGLDTATVTMSALKKNLGPTLDLFADVIQNPAFRQEDFDRIRKEQLVRMKQSKLEPNAMGRRVLPALLYGAGHPYGELGGGSGTEESLAKLTRDQLVAYHSQWFKPNNARLVVVGDTTLVEILPLLEKRFAGWQAGTVPTKTIGAPRPVEKPVVYLMDRPGAPQSLILAAAIAPAKNTPDEFAIKTMNRVFGGQFSSRINMNLRQDKHWSYGARSSIQDARGPRTFMASAPVQTDKTKESLVEVKKELDGILGGRPITAEELEMAKDQDTLGLSGQWETNNAVLGSIADLVEFNLPDSYWNGYAARIRALTIPDLDGAAKKILGEKRIVWIVIGDRAKIEAGVRETGIGEVVVIDPDGRPLAAKAES